MAMLLTKFSIYASDLMVEHNHLRCKDPSALLICCVSHMQMAP